ncbi:unnamed protein product [Paramecium pentaurelia]|uniref:Transmembrane protein n=1 Tax=Paramecium pentaurelia TaxID=43138 RepID=A0A8S1YCS4_9CILI|nr:unnamed protein product [Paramecium pentaurelia]
MITQKINKNYLQFHCNILINYFTNNKDEFKILNNKSIKEHLLFILLSTIIDYIYNAPGSLEKPFVLILEGLLTLTICTDIVLKVITEGLVLQFIILYFNTNQRYSSQQLGIFQIQVHFYQSQLVQECNKKYIMMNFLGFHLFQCVICHLLFVQLSYAIQMMQQQRDILIYKKSRNQDLSILDISSEILNDSQFVETMKLVSD